MKNYFGSVQFMRKRNRFSCSLKGTIAQHVHEKKKPFKCEICYFRFSQKGDMNKHIVLVHEKKKLFKCEICDYKFSQKGDINKHIVSVHEKKKLFKCEICDYNFSQKYTMT